MANMAERFEDLINRTKAMYGTMMSKVIGETYAYMSGDDIDMINDSMRLMNEALDLSVEIVRRNEELADEMTKMVKENNKILKELVDSKREV